MPNKRADAEALVTASTEGLGISIANREQLINAVAHDLRAASDEAAAAKARLDKVAMQTRALTDATKALLAAVEVVTLSAQAVKDALQEPVPSPGNSVRQSAP